MDWRRAKTIFIISFFLLDLFLITQISQMIEQKSNYLKTDEITEEQIRDLLETSQIQMTKPMQDHVTKIPALQAQITPIPGWDYNEKWVYHKSLHPALSFSDQTSLEKLLKQRLSFFDEYRYAKEYSQKSHTAFLQYYQTHPIFDGKITAHIKDGKLNRIQALHFQIKEKVPVDFIPFTHAIHDLITRENLPKGATISDVVLGYRSMYYPNPKEVILVPVWRFTVNQKHYYIYATNNNLNEDSSWNSNK